MKTKYSLKIEQNIEFKMSVLISPSKSLISSRWVTIVRKAYLILPYELTKNSEELLSVYL